MLTSLYRVRDEISGDLVEFECSGKPSGNTKVVFKTDADARKAATAFAETQQAVQVAKIISDLAGAEISDDPKQIQAFYGKIVDQLRAKEGAVAVELFNALRDTGLLAGKMRQAG